LEHRPNTLNTHTLRMHSQSKQSLDVTYGVHGSRTFSRRAEYRPSFYSSVSSVRWCHSTIVSRRRPARAHTRMSQRTHARAVRDTRDATSVKTGLPAVRVNTQCADPPTAASQPTTQYAEWSPDTENPIRCTNMDRHLSRIISLRGSAL